MNDQTEEVIGENRNGLTFKRAALNVFINIIYVVIFIISLGSLLLEGYGNKGLEYVFLFGAIVLIAINSIKLKMGLKPVFLPERLASYKYWFLCSQILLLSGIFLILKEFYLYGGLLVISGALISINIQYRLVDTLKSVISGVVSDVKNIEYSIARFRLIVGVAIFLSIFIYAWGFSPNPFNVPFIERLFFSVFNSYLIAGLVVGFLSLTEIRLAIKSYLRDFEGDVAAHDLYIQTGGAEGSRTLHSFDTGNAIARMSYWIGVIISSVIVGVILIPVYAKRVIKKVKE